MQYQTPKLTVHDFFHAYIFSREEAYMHLSEKDQKIVKIAKFIFSILTCGLAPKFCKRRWENSQNCKTQVKNLALRLKGCNYFNLPAFIENRDVIKQSQNKDCDRILNGLFLGSSKGLVEATTLKFKVLKDNYLIPQEFTNQYQFTSVITMCPMEAIIGDYSELDKEELASNFSSRKVTWLHPGKDLSDHKQAGFDLAYNATFLNSALILETLVGHTEEEIKNLSEQKRITLKERHIQEWFEPVFAEMDKAVLGRGNTLVHCQAGVSRSATLVAAYLINRFDLPAETAMNYLRNKRACVNPKFVPFLHEYAERLHNKNS